PIVLVEISGSKQLKLMRSDLSHRTRHATLQPRRLLDVIPTGIGIVGGLVYAGFALLTLGIQFSDPETDRGFFSLLIVTLGNVFFIGIVYWNLYGRNQDPYRSDETRLSQIRTVAKSLILISIAATAFAGFTLVLDILKVESAEGISLCFYLQLIALLSLSSFKIDNVDFEVYRETAASS
ncbi:MAG: hypothetical protein AB8B95_12975, partial [Pseudohongiellaceae bacterium]